MIRFGPAAAPRWFDLSSNRFEEYLDLITDSGANAIEFVALPEPGSEELRRVHIPASEWPGYVAAARHRDLTINVHWPLPPQYRFEAYRVDPVAWYQHARLIMSMVDLVARTQPVPPVMIVHGDSDDPESTMKAINLVLALTKSSVTAAVELRAPATPDDRRWDRSRASLTAAITDFGSDRVGICWDIANDWLQDSALPNPESAFLALVRHVHLHDSRPDRTVHAPLGTGLVPWRGQVENLEKCDWTGTITTEIRYRYASETGEPWRVLADSLSQVHNVIQTENKTADANR